MAVVVVGNFFKEIETEGLKVEIMDNGNRKRGINDVKFLDEK